jgi:hypothetical protein
MSGTRTTSHTPTRTRTRACAHVMARYSIVSVLGGKAPACRVTPTCQLLAGSSMLVGGIVIFGGAGNYLTPSSQSYAAISFSTSLPHRCIRVYSFIVFLSNAYVGPSHMALSALHARALSFRLTRDFTTAS